MGVYYGENHPFNACGRVNSRSQTAYRAELRALAHVVNTATEPTWMVTDCKSAALQLAKMIRARDAGEEVVLPSSNSDIWAAIHAAISAARPGYFQVTWTKAHLTGEAAEKAIREGKTTAEAVRRNDNVDTLAKAGAALHGIPEERVHVAKLKARLAAAVQGMFVAQ